MMMNDRENMNAITSIPGQNRWLSGETWTCGAETCWKIRTLLV